MPPTILPPFLLNLRVALFPGNARGPPAPEPPSPAERLQIRRRCAQAILSLVPPLIARAFFNVRGGGEDEGPAAAEAEAGEGKGEGKGEGEDEEMLVQIEDMLDVFGDAYLNRHLVYNVLELVIARLVPEMGELTPSELLKERGVGLR